MAGAALEFVDAAIQIGTTIAGIFNGNKEDQNFRSGWTQQAVGQLSTDNPGKNIMVIYTDHDASKLVNSEKKVLACPCPNSGAQLSYGVYIFDSGPFTLKGDGGYLNWCFCGNFKRDDKTVNFNKP